MGSIAGGRLVQNAVKIVGARFFRREKVKSLRNGTEQRNSRHKVVEPSAPKTEKQNYEKQHVKNEIPVFVIVLLGTGSACI
jgi:hypothetical protein